MFSLLVETAEKRAVDNLFSDELARIPEFSASEARAISCCPVKRIQKPWDSRVFTPKDPTDWTIQVALGGGFILPAAGTWPIAYGASTSEVIISNDPTEDEISDILNGLASIVSAGGVTVQGANGFFTFTFDAVGARTMLSGDPELLVSLSLLTFERVVTGDASTQEVQILRITQNAGTYATLSTMASAASVAFSLIQAGSGSANAKWRITLSSNLWAGYWTFTKPAGATSDPIGWADSEAEMKTVFEGLYGSGNVLVRQETDDTFTVEHIGTNTHTAMTIVSTVDATALKCVLFKSGLLDLRVPGIEMLLSGSQEAMVKFEVQAADATGYPEKILQRDVRLVRPVLTAEMTMPVPPEGVAELLTGLSGTFSDLAVSSAATTDLAPTTEFIQWFQLVSAAAGSGAYTRKLTLDNTKARDGAIFRIEIDLAASANPTIQFFDESVVGNKMDEVTGRADMATYYVFEARFDGTNWQKLRGEFQT